MWAEGGSARAAFLASPQSRKHSRASVEEASYAWEGARTATVKASEGVSSACRHCLYWRVISRWPTHAVTELVASRVPSRCAPN